MTCKRTDADPIVLTIKINPDDFKVGDKIKVTGSLQEGNRGYGRRGSWGKQLKGTAKLTSAGMNDDDAIEGEFDLEITEMRGGPW